MQKKIGCFPICQLNVHVTLKLSWFSATVRLGLREECSRPGIVIIDIIILVSYSNTIATTRHSIYILYRCMAIAIPLALGHFPPVPACSIANTAIKINNVEYIIIF